VLEWWDGVELWLVQLPYPFAVTVVLVVLVPLSWGVASVFERGIEAFDAWRRRRASAHEQQQRHTVPNDRGAAPT
jgi:hypothetical protein